MPPSDQGQLQNQPATAPTTEASTSAGSAASTPTTAPDGRDSTLLGGGDAPAPASPDTKPEEKKEAAPQAPPADINKLTWPEGYDKPNEELLGKFGETAKSLNLTQDGAQQLANLYTEAQKAASETNVQAWKSTLDAWENEVKADPNIGGAKWDATRAAFGKLLADPRFATDGVREALNLTGAGSNPAIVRFFAKVANALTEGGVVGAGGPAQQQRPRTAAQAMYPNLPSSEGA